MSNINFGGGDETGDRMSVEDRIKFDAADEMVTDSVAYVDADSNQSQQVQSMYSGSYKFGTELYKDIDSGILNIVVPVGDGGSSPFIPDLVRIDEYSSIDEVDTGETQLFVNAYGITIPADQCDIEVGQTLYLKTQGVHDYRGEVTDVGEVEHTYDGRELVTVVTGPLEQSDEGGWFTQGSPPPSSTDSNADHSNDGGGAEDED